MKLNLGERFIGSGPAHQPGGYLVTGVVCETPWYGLYTGKKIFYNFDFSAKRPREADEKEWLDVFLRTIRYPFLDDAEYVKRRRLLARKEIHRLGRRQSNLWPEPLDLLEVVNTRDPFTFAPGDLQDKEPILVFARPHGQPLGEWQHSVLPLASILGVLAELLRFIEESHDEGLLLNGLGPAAVLVDRADRIHYLGTEMVMELERESGETRFLGETGFLPGLRLDPAGWAKVFPADRYPRGFAAPECFTPAVLPDGRSDLYAWGCLAYFLLAGHVPWQIARDQNRPWAFFQEDHFSRLEKALRSVPPAHVRHWAEQLNLPAEPLVRHWPGNLLAVFRLLLDPQPQGRPASAGQLRAWIERPPPPSVTAILALRRDADHATLLIDQRGLPRDLDIVIRRGRDFVPLTPYDGDLVAEGPHFPCVEDFPLPKFAAQLHYAVFARTRQGESFHYSAAAVTALWDTNAEHLRSLAEEEASRPGSHEEPPRIALIFAALDLLVACRALLSSPLLQVRRWAIRRLVQALDRPAPPAGVEALLWEAAADQAAPLRLEAAQALWRHAPVQDDALGLRLARAMGRGGLDDAVGAARSLPQVGVDDARVHRVVQVLEEERPAACPVCLVQLSGRDRVHHLRSVHGYVDVAGSLLPRDAALSRLWSRVFFQGDERAHEQILEVCAAPSADIGGDNPLAEAYAASLESELDDIGRISNPSSREEDPRASPPLSFSHDRYVQCLRQASKFDLLAPRLLVSREARVRELAREALLPLLAERLRGEKLTAELLRQRLDRVYPRPDSLDEKILVCQRLVQFGLDPGPLSVCLIQLQDERPTACPECRQVVRRGELERHLRGTHGIFQFRGARGPFAAVRAGILEALCGALPDPAAWKALEDLARDRYGRKAPKRLVTWICQKLRVAPSKRRAAAAASMAEAMSTLGDGPDLLPLLLAPAQTSLLQTVARLLALEIVARLKDVPEDLTSSVLPLLADSHVPRPTRQRAVATLLQAADPAGPQAMELLEAYAAGSGKLRAIDKLHELEQQVGKSPAIDNLCARLEDQIRMHCPRCQIELRRAQMVHHLWDHHLLVLDGRRVREPWRVIEDWLVDYQLEKDAALLEQCRDLARLLDPQGGLLRLQRLLLRHGVADPAARAAWVEQAKKKKASLCPHCFTLAPTPEVRVPQALVFDDEQLAGHGYRLEVSDRGLVPWLEIAALRGTLVARREPGRFWTRNGGLVFLVGPLVLIAFILTEWLTASQLPALGVLAVAIGFGLFYGGLVYLFWPAPPSTRDRLVDAAWTTLVPLLLMEDPAVNDIAFFAGLALVSLEHGNPARRRALLDSACLAVEKSAALEPDALSALAYLWCLQAHDAWLEGDDPVLLLVEQAQRCFTGELPFAYAGLLLEGLTAKPSGHPRWAGWSSGMVQRLRVLLADRAFTLGLTLNDLADLARSHAALAAFFDLEHPDNLARLFLLWSVLPQRPWESAGHATTVFELAKDPARGEKWLTRYPDLLLTVRGMPLCLAASGAWFQDELIPAMPATVDVEPRRQDKGYDLIVGNQRFWFLHNPKTLAHDLEQWLRFFFQELLPQASEVQTATVSSETARKTKLKNALACPECHRAMLPRQGEVGIAVEENLVPTLT